MKKFFAALALSTAGLALAQAPSQPPATPQQQLQAVAQQANDVYVKLQDQRKKLSGLDEFTLYEMYQGQLEQLQRRYADLQQQANSQPPAAPAPASPPAKPVPAPAKPVTPAAPKK